MMEKYDHWQIMKYERHDKNGNSVTIEYRGKGKWGVYKNGRSCLARDGTFDLELQPSSRTDEWLENHRFDNMVDAFSAAEEAFEFA